MNDETSEKQDAVEEVGSLEVARRLISASREMRRRSYKLVQQAQDQLDEENDLRERAAAYSRRTIR